MTDEEREGLRNAVENYYLKVKGEPMPEDVETLDDEDLMALAAICGRKLAEFDKALNPPA